MSNKTRKNIHEEYSQTSIYVLLYLRTFELHTIFLNILL